MGETHDKGGHAQSVTSFVSSPRWQPPEVLVESEQCVQVARLAGERNTTSQVALAFGPVTPRGWRRPKKVIGSLVGTSTRCVLMILPQVHLRNGETSADSNVPLLVSKETRLYLKLARQTHHHLVCEQHPCTTCLGLGCG